MLVEIAAAAGCQADFMHCSTLMGVSACGTARLRQPITQATRLTEGHALERCTCNLGGMECVILQDKDAIADRNLACTLGQPCRA